MSRDLEAENLSSADVTFITISEILRYLCAVVGCPIAAAWQSWRFSGVDFWKEFLLLLLLYELYVVIGFKVISFIYVAVSSQSNDVKDS